MTTPLFKRYDLAVRKKILTAGWSVEQAFAQIMEAYWGKAAKKFVKFAYRETETLHEFKCCEKGGFFGNEYLKQLERDGWTIYRDSVRVVTVEGEQKP